mgnify:CR=1 FL=1
MEKSTFTITVELTGELTECQLKKLRQVCLMEVREVCQVQLHAMSTRLESIRSNVCGD